MRFKLRIRWKEPSQPRPATENIFPSDRRKVLWPSPNPPLFSPTLHAVDSSHPRHDPVKLVHEHAQREDRGGAR